MIKTDIAVAFTAVSALMMTLGGCASAVDRNYGKAVHQMMAAQVYRPETLKQPSNDPVEGVQADSAKAAVDAMRKDTAERTHAQQPIIFTYGAPAQ